MHINSSTNRLLGTALMCGCFLAQAAYGATRYDAVKQFSIKANPNGVWSYVDSAPLAYAHRHYKGAVGLYNWSNDGSKARGDDASVIINMTGSAITFNNGKLTIPTGVLVLDSEDHQPGAGVQFQAPLAGTYKVSCSMLGLNTDEARDADIYVSLNGTGIARIRIHSGQRRHYRKTLTLAPGDTLEFLDQRDPRHKPDYIGIALKIEGP